MCDSNVHLFDSTVIFEAVTANLSNRTPKQPSLTINLQYIIHNEAHLHTWLSLRPLIFFEALVFVRNASLGKDKTNWLGQAVNVKVGQFVMRHFPIVSKNNVLFSPATI